MVWSILIFSSCIISWRHYYISWHVIAYFPGVSSLACACTLPPRPRGSSAKQKAAAPPGTTSPRSQWRSWSRLRTRPVLGATRPASLLPPAPCCRADRRRGSLASRRSSSWAPVRRAGVCLDACRRPRKQPLTDRNWVREDITDTRFDWRLPSGVAAPPLEEEEEDDFSAGIEGVDPKQWGGELGPGHSDFLHRARNSTWLQRVWNSLPTVVQAGLTPPPNFSHPDGNVSDIDPRVGMFTPEELLMFRAPGNGPIARLSKEELERYEDERLRRRWQSCPFGPDDLSENYPFLPPSFRFRFTSAEELSRAELFPGVDGRRLLPRLQPKYDPLRAPRMVEEQRSHLESLVM